MRLGKDVLEADLYGELGVLPDATDSEIRLAYRRQARVSHPDLNHQDPAAVARMKRLNLAANVLLDAALRRAYDRAPRGERHRAPAPTPPNSAWYERREQSGSSSWAPPPRPATASHGSRFDNFLQQLRGRDGKLGLRAQELVESLSARQQLSVAALLFAIALGLLAMSKPQNLGGDSPHPTGMGSLSPR
jgi:curved DNA-binding protein CbpA